MASFDYVAFIKYLLEGLAVAVAMYLVQKNKTNIRELIIIALTASATFAVLDQFSPYTSSGARQGSGIGIGASVVGGSADAMGGYNIEGFDDSEEGFDAVPALQQGKANVCALNGTTCSYGSSATQEEKHHYVCTMQNGQCSATKACAKTNGTCLLAPGVQPTDVSGRSCVPVNDCQLKASTEPEAFSF